jgi:hypothetical protein
MRACIVFVMALLLCHSVVNAEYYLYFMNNTNENMTLMNTCDSKLPGSACKVHHNGKLDAFKRVESHVINYDQHITWGHQYTLITYFSMPGDEKEVRNNFFETVFHGDFIGSHIVEIGISVNGVKHVLLDDKNSKDKVLPNKIGQLDYKYTDGNTYTFYVNAQADHVSDQGIDSIYYSIDKKPSILSSEEDNELTVVTYNIQAFPNYIGIALDLNKMDSRVHYLSNVDAMKHADVVVFQEAWDHASRDVLKNMFHNTYGYSYDPVPDNTHLKPLNSGLLILSRHPFTQKYFVNYQDHQSLVDADRLSNKGAAYFKIDKNGKSYNLIATHTQAQDDQKSLAVRQEEFRIINKEIINNHGLSIPAHEPLFFLGDTNTSFYNKHEFDYMQSTLNLNAEGVTQNLSKAPRFSYDSSLNLMIDPKVTEYGLYDMVLPVKGFLQPSKSVSQITPLRALDSNRMYQRSLNTKLYNYGDVELSDHFMVQAKFTFDGY